MMSKWFHLLLSGFAVVAMAAKPDESLVTYRKVGGGAVELDQVSFETFEAAGRALRGRSCKRNQKYNSTVLVEHDGAKMDKYLTELELNALAGGFLTAYNKMNPLNIYNDRKCDKKFRRIDSVRAESMGTYDKMIDLHTFIPKRLIMYHCEASCEGGGKDTYLFHHDDVEDRRKLGKKEGKYAAAAEEGEDFMETCKCPKGSDKFDPSEEQFLYMLNGDIQELVMDPNVLKEKEEKMRQGRKKQREKLEEDQKQHFADLEGLKIIDIKAEEEQHKEDLEKMQDDHKLALELKEDENKLKKDEREDDFDDDLDYAIATWENSENLNEDNWEHYCEETLKQLNHDLEDQDKEDFEQMRKDFEDKEKKCKEDWEDKKKTMEAEAKALKDQYGDVIKEMEKMQKLEDERKKEDEDFINDLKDLYDEHGLTTSAADGLVELEEVDCPEDPDEFKADVYVEYEGLPDDDDDLNAIIPNLENGFVYAYNDLANYFCDPLHRKVEKAELKLVSSSRRKLGKRRLRLKTSGTCRQCTNSDGLFDDTSGRRILEALGEGVLPNPYPVRALFGEDDKCYCPKGKWVETPPPSSLFAHWYNGTQEIEDAGVQVCAVEDA